ncbi:MFS general substrate transporter [Guyanagaster necrorhizus]|uniref:MFS general substrate transporter n=1 Tax=Guyanagaster necrorhizus TaxID=856835 RepID=A0A9P7W2J4_9AGAR|nr:MFS general substrate transporter [Guyanagaster necrorhizus MCA 3950]KAG7450839.1 MFS general substrate transporter [Guyanagaster necrorhizus MCA 3950]
MAEPVVDNEKSYTGSSNDDHAARKVYQQPTGLKGLYYNPITQIVMLGFVCFMGPGLFNALNGLGAGGQVDSKTNSNANTALYSTFSFMGFFGGSVNNVLGPRLTLLIGSMGYSLYIGSYLAINIHSNAGGFVVAAGAILGICAGLLWTAQGSLMMAYPTETQKGKFIGIFWSIFNLGGVVGASVAAGRNWKSTVGFLVLTLIGVFIPMLMANPNKMIRSDGTKVMTPRHPSLKTEILGLLVTLKTDPMIILLFPMFFASNWFYTWQFSGFNGAIFDIRARGLNNVCYWISQIIGSVLIGLLLDRKSISRRIRAYTGWTVLFLMVFVVHIWGYFYQKQYTRESVAPETEKMDIYDHGYAGRVMFYIFCGILDAMWQTTSYWLMGAMSNDPSKLAFFAGFYKSIQSAGAAGIWRADAVKIPYMNMFISEWALLVGGLVFALPMVIMRIKDHTDLDDEIIARMDDRGHIRPTEDVAAEMDVTAKDARAS